MPPYRCTQFSLLIISLYCFCCLAMPARADEVAEAGRRIAGAYGEAMVSVQVISKTRYNFGGEEMIDEERYWTNGVVIDPSGLVVVSLTTINPNESMRRMYDMSDLEGMSIASELTDVKIRLSDGGELPAKVVLRDLDLDLAFIRPLAPPATPLAAVDLINAGTPDILDPIIFMTRTGTVANRSLCMSVGRIHTLVAKPRLFYFSGVMSVANGLGSAVFTLDGAPVGLVVLRTLPQGASDDSCMGSGIGNAKAIYIILPAGDIACAAEQAPAAE